MATQVNKLTSLGVQRKKKPGLYNDGGGLYLQVSANGAKSWIFRFKSDGQARYMGLGSLITVGLSDARAAALDCRKLRQQGIDPIDRRKGLRTEAELTAAKAITFDACRDAYIAARSPSWKNRKHRDQWTNSLTTYASPVIGQISVQAVDVEAIEKVLKPIWNTKTETAKRVQGRIESILDWAKIKGYREGENPARWKGHLDQLLPAPSKLQKVRHHPSLPYLELPGFMTELRERSEVAAKALEFVILTAARTNEVLGAAWDEIDLEKRIWTIGAERMKMPREHRVPLSEPAIDILKNVQKSKFGEFVFPGAWKGKPLSNMAMLKTLERMKRRDITVHGFRSTFRTWAAEQTNCPREVVEAALAHVIQNKVEAAYQRSDLLEKRRALMDEWGDYCSAQAHPSKARKT